jgi:hypothetical protein
VFVNYDLGYYVQDSWRINRLTLNLGMRVDNFRSMYEASANPAGRFVPARYFPERRNIPNWNNDFAPRLSFGYDLFGNGRTALKASWSKYYERLTGGFANNYAPGVQNESRNWSDCDVVPGTSTCSTAVLATNGDDIAQLNEIGPSGTTNFGLTVGDRDMDPNIQRQGNREITVTGSHQLFPRVSVTAGWYHRTYQDIQQTDRTLITTADYVSFSTPVPAEVSRDAAAAAVIDRSAPLTVYNLVSTKRSVFNTALVDKNLPDRSIYNGVDVSFQARLMAGSTLFGSWTTERNLSVFCSTDDNPNGPPVADLYTGVSVANGGRFCDQRQFNVPFVHEFKLAGNYPVPHVGLDVGVILQSYAGLARAITYQPAAGLFPGGRTNTETIILNEPGSLYYPRYNQLDLNFKKNFRFGTKSFSGQIDFFNVLNGNAIFARQDTVGNALGDVTTILQGRLTRVAFQMKF